MLSALVPLIIGMIPTILGCLAYKDVWRNLMDTTSAGQRMVSAMRKHKRMYKWVRSTVVLSVCKVL